MRRCDVRISSTTNPRAFFVNVAFVTVALLFLQAVAFAQACGGNQVIRTSATSPALPEQIAERYDWLYHPTFAKLDLARMLPELNDPPEKLRAPFRVNDSISFRLLIRNTSAESKSFILDSAYRYDRPALYKGGVLMPYRKDVLDKIVMTDNPRGDYSRFEQLRPGEEFTEIIKLGDWYKPLQQGRYELKMCRRFIWGGEWLETPPLAFDVVP